MNKMLGPEGVQAEIKKTWNLITPLKAKHYTCRQINQDRMIFGDFSVNSKPIFFKFCEGHFLFKS